MNLPIWTIDRDEPAYPRCLLDLGGGVPGRLFGCGDRGLVSGLEVRHTVTIVGSRRASSYGLEVAERLSGLVAAAGLVVVSGMARGIDAAAHRGALTAGGSTVAVLGGGPDVIYPSGNRRLYRDILATGAILSEVPPGVRPRKSSFPVRNRIMAGLAAMTVVVEAATPSGSLVTARHALSLGRIVGAVPGPVTSRSSQGANDLLADGGVPIRDAQDVLDHLLGVGATQVRRVGSALEPALARVVELVEAGSRSPDAVATGSGMAPGEAAVALSRLELLGYVRVDSDGRYTRTGLTAPEVDRGDPTTLEA